MKACRARPALRAVFSFDSNPEPSLEPPGFRAGDAVVRVPAGIARKDELLEFLSRELGFPEYFGGNWDALLDSLCDLSGIPESRVFLVHADLPLKDPADRAAYLEVLREAEARWSRWDDGDLFAVFPATRRGVIEGILAPESDDES